ncbi:hypothetical protein OAA60_01900 [Porticoccaceae bacterium]|jgi:hypothetical protein|nr:hypothetical protein [Porticoccaceae bacterium]
MDNCQRLYSVYSKCILYTALKQKYNIDYNFKLTPLNKRDIYLSDYYFTINKTNNDITKKCDIIRMHDSEDDIDIDELPDEAVYDENENVYCFYKYHICENNEKYEYYKQIFINKLMYDLKYALKNNGLKDETKIIKYIENNSPVNKKNSGLMQIISHGSQDTILTIN